MIRSFVARNDVDEESSADSSFLKNNNNNKLEKKSRKRGIILSFELLVAMQHQELVVLRPQLAAIRMLVAK